MNRKTHLLDTAKGGPTCKGGRSGASLHAREHITVRYAAFAAANDQCERCRSGKLFAFLVRQAAKAA